MSAIEEDSIRKSSGGSRRWLLGFAVAIVAVVAIAAFVAGANRLGEAGRTKEEAVLTAFQQETAASDSEHAAKLHTDQVIWPISAAGLANGLDLEAVTRQVRGYQAENAHFQAIVRSRPDTLKERLSGAGFRGSRQRKIIEAWTAQRDPAVATQAFLLRHELGEEVLMIAELLDRRRGAWRMIGDALVFETNVDRQLYERAVNRQMEIERSVPKL